jgi:hypothetical protein
MLGAGYLLVLVLIVSMDKQMLPVGILLMMVYALAYMPSLSELAERFIGHYGPAVSNCDNYSAESIKMIGTAFYPLHEKNGDDLQPGSLSPF